jgi:signal peptidase I
MSVPSKPPSRDPFREAVETLVFVVTLVLMLKLFAVEAFVIPTGSMAETLYGYHKRVTCPDCGHLYPVNATEEAEAQPRQNPNGGPPVAAVTLLTGATCPNCRFHTEFPRNGGPSYDSGDRVLVHKAIYALKKPDRTDVVVFKFPVDPQSAYTAQNYIKRLWGLSGETIGIYRGDLYRATALEYPEGELDTFGEMKYPRPSPEESGRLWEGPAVRESSRTTPPYPPYNADSVDYTYHNTPMAVNRFHGDLLRGFAGTAFEPLRKSPAVALAMRRVVYDNAHQSQFLLAKGVPPRWTPGGSGWQPPADAGPKAFKHDGGEGRLTYLHRVPGPPLEIPPHTQFDRAATVSDRERLASGYQEGLFSPAPITNFLGYNSAESAGRPTRDNGQFPVLDLMLEATATLQDGATVALEVGKGTRRFRATFDGREVRIDILGPAGRELARAPAVLKSGKAHDLRLANFDAQVRVWVDGTLVELPGDGTYTPWESGGFDTAAGGVLGGVFSPAPWGGTVQNDLSGPAAVVVTGGVEVTGLRLFADTFFTPAGTQRGQDADPEDPIDTYYVQPGHYFCLGDNSGQSLDGRVWGLVPERLMLGKAEFVFWPRHRVGFIK